MNAIARGRREVGGGCIAGEPRANAPGAHYLRDERERERERESEREAARKEGTRCRRGKRAGEARAQSGTRHSSRTSTFARRRASREHRLTGAAVVTEYRRAVTGRFHPSGGFVFFFLLFIYFFIFFKLQYEDPVESC